MTAKKRHGIFRGITTTFERQMETSQYISLPFQSKFIKVSETVKRWLSKQLSVGAESSLNKNISDNFKCEEQMTLINSREFQIEVELAKIAFRGALRFSDRLKFKTSH